MRLQDHVLEPLYEAIQGLDEPAAIKALGQFDVEQRQIVTDEQPLPTKTRKTRRKKIFA